MMLFTLSVPDDDWFTPIENAVIDALGLREQLVELAQARGIHAARSGDSIHIASVVMSGRKRIRDVHRVLGYERGVRVPLLVQIREQPVEQPHIRAGAHRQVHRRDLARRRATRIDDDDLQLRPLLLRAHDALEQDRVAPRRVRADQHDEIRQLQILVAARARCPRRTRACDPPPPTPCRAGSSCRCSPCR